MAKEMTEEQREGIRRHDAERKAMCDKINREYNEGKRIKGRHRK